MINSLFRGRRCRSRGLVLAALVGGILLIGACGTTEDAPYVERPVNELYNQAMDDLEAGDNKKAAKLFDEVERQHPYSSWATKAQLLAAYAHYRANEYDEAVSALDRYIELHPASPDVPYAYYLKGLSYYERISDIHRDQEMSEQARRVFEELVNRYPDSEYARDARLKIDLCDDHLAGKEMVVGRYYLAAGLLSGGNQSVQDGNRQVSGDDARSRGIVAVDGILYRAWHRRRGAEIGGRAGL